MEIEFLDSDGAWHVIDDAGATAVFPNSYEVRVPLAPMWIVHKLVLESMTFRVAGRVSAKAYVQSTTDESLTLMLLVE